MFREKTRKIYVGGVPVGGGSPVTVQSMANTKTADIEKTGKQLARLEKAGCDIVRVAVPDLISAQAIGELKKRVRMPIVADIHFDHRLALASVQSGADKIRINPGNLGPLHKLREVAAACADKGVPIRVGVNSGSLEKRLLERYGGVTAQALCESALEQAERLHSLSFFDICLSVKSPHAPLTVAACRLLAEKTDCPLHLGITESGPGTSGLIHSSVGLGALLLMGIGDTIRVSLTDDPAQEVRAGIEILKAAGLRRGGVRLISCPSCGRCEIDLIDLTAQVEAGLSGIRRELTVAVMGCPVNGPGEARAADYGIAGGKEGGVLFKKGRVVCALPARELADALIKLIESENQQ